jgi:hypothetical protein
VAILGGYHNKSTLNTSQRPVEQCPAYFGDPTLADDMPNCQCLPVFV